MKKVLSCVLMLFLFFQISSINVLATDFKQPVSPEHLFQERLEQFFRSSESIQVVDQEGNDVSTKIKMQFSSTSIYKDIDKVKSYFTDNHLSIVEFIPLEYENPLNRISPLSLVILPYSVRVTGIRNVYGRTDFTIDYKYSGTLNYDNINKKITTYSQPQFHYFDSNYPAKKTHDTTTASLGTNAAFLKININIKYDYLHFIGYYYDTYSYSEIRTYNYYPNSN
jgi:uncharacterized protein YnzC (UPF0291/DUF896 family)